MPSRSPKRMRTRTRYPNSNRGSGEEKNYLSDNLRRVVPTESDQACHILENDEISDTIDQRPSLFTNGEGELESTSSSSPTIQDSNEAVIPMMMDSYFERLMDLIPTHDLEPFPPPNISSRNESSEEFPSKNSSMSKFELLKSAIQYIYDLQDILNLPSGPDTEKSQPFGMPSPNNHQTSLNNTSHYMSTILN